MRYTGSIAGGVAASLVLSFLAACGPADAQVQQNILVDPAGGAKPGFTTVARLADVPFASLGPGSQVLVRGGNYGDVVFIGSRGTEAAPVTVAAEVGTQPRLSNSVVFENAAYVTVTGLTVQGATNSGFIIRRGSHHVTVSGSNVSRSGLGIWIGEGAGAGHRLTGNTLTDNKTHGVAIDVINAPPEDPSYIFDNIVTGNGIHGMEINGSGYVIEGNRVSGNGVGMSGTSGIHVYAKNAAQDAGDRNTIRYNIVTDQKETTGQDGNGIQIDQWCDGNIVAFNVAADNDGAGINLFDAGSNVVVNNTATGNMRDSGGKHVYRGEIVLASDYTKQLDRTAKNRVLNNIAYATRPGVAALVVEATTIDNDNAIGPNFLGSSAGTPLYRWGKRAVGDGSGLPLNGMAPDLVGTPAFRAAASPMTGGLALTSAPTRAGIPLGATRDIAGRAYAPGDAPTFGAYRSP